MFTNTKKIMSLALLLVSYCVFAENNAAVISGEKFEKYGDRIISEKLFGSYDPSRKQFVYIAAKDDITKTYYFYEMKNDIMCLAYVKRDASSPQNVCVLLNTAYHTGSKCMILYGKTLFDQENPVLYFWEGNEKAAESDTVEQVSYTVNGFSYTAEILQDIRELVIANSNESQKFEADLQTVSGLQVFEELRKVTFFNFKEVSLNTLKTNPKTELYFSMCDTISSIRELVSSSRQILRFEIVNR